MNIDRQAIQERLRNFDLSELFTQELGWEFPPNNLVVEVEGHRYDLKAIAEKRGLVVFTCSPNPEGKIPLSHTRGKIERQVAKSNHEHIIVFVDEACTQQKWLWVRREPGGPIRNNDYDYHEGQSGESLAQRLETLFVTLDEEENLTLPDVVGRVRAAFDVERLTRRFYDLFKKEHSAFLEFIEGIADQGDREWYTSIMLNRLMFLYFIQRKGFLANDPNYLRNRLTSIQEQHGKDQFHSFYRYFLLRLMHEGLNQLQDKRQDDLDKLIGDVPYLNGGIFEEHQLEKQYDLDIPDSAFERIFDFFDQYRWHLDERPLRKGNEINPDVLGYIFEKYINQKQMGAYYTKEDITEYIGKNTILPFLFNAARKTCKTAFAADSALWRLLSENPDLYIYEAVRRGVIDDQGEVIPLPAEIEAGIGEVGQRDGWNKAAPAPYALPAETWREHISRRQRCLELRQKLARGEITEINDLITYNLDIRQFAQDAIVHCEDPKLLRAFYQAIEKVTVLDPTCGSGAFLFAALNILEPLYEASLESMRRLVGELDSSGKKAHAQKYSDFRKTLDRAAKHPNQHYFIYKSIILNNLYGVDIMEEATEICKLRLFLKLVAQIETVDKIEPLPDIDFNIRAGNTLVGFATYEDVNDAVTSKLDFDNALPKIEEKAEDIDRLFAHFRRQQTELGGEITSEHKQQLRERLGELEEELNHYLAQEYGIDAGNKKQKKKYEEWLASHQPFHWFVDFYGIMKDGGFDVIIGNPPYVEYRASTISYTIKDYETELCGNLYAFTLERCIILCRASGGFISMIVPVASVCADGYQPLRKCLAESGNSIISSYNDRPSKLFDGLEHIRLSIIIHNLTKEKSGSFSTTYNKWQAIERINLFKNIAFAENSTHNLNGAIAKIGDPIEISILTKFNKDKGQIAKYGDSYGKHGICYTRKLSHFVQILDFIPKMTDADGNRRDPSELKKLQFSKKEARDVFLCLLNSNLFYWLLTVFSDCRNLNRREIDYVRFDIKSADPALIKELSRLSRKLMKDINSNSEVLTMNYKRLGILNIQCTYPKYSKPIIDEIDRVLAQHYGFTDEELDFIINYDIKYRVGADRDDE